MPLTLVTGPANAAKAGAVFARLRARLADDPLLVVPTPGDVVHYQRELAESGIVFGAEVLTFSQLVELIAGRTGTTGRPLGPVARERVIRAVVSEAPLRRLSRSAASGGFSLAAGALFAELQRELVPPARLVSAVRAWAAADPTGRHGEAEEAAGLYAAYLRRLESLGARDAEGFAWAALDGLRREPRAWDGRPVFLYGFDDLTRTELDAVETLVRRAEADVLVSLPYEPGRAAFGGRATTVEILRPLAAEHVALPERSEHYEPGARAALHHLERHLFEAAPETRGEHAGLLLLEAGGERAEAELVAAEVLGLIGRGMAAGDIAVVSRGGEAAQDLMAQVLHAYGVPVARRRRVPLARTRLGSGLLALVRASAGAGGAPDLLRWLRTPGAVAAPEPVDALERLVLRGDVEDVAGACRAWTGPARDLDALERLRTAAGTGPGTLLEALVGIAAGTWEAPHARRAAVLGDEEAADAHVVAGMRRAVGELERLVARDAGLLPDVAAAVEALSSLEIREREAHAGVLLADPLEIRARRFRAVFATGLQDDAMPRPVPPDPFLDDDDRRGLARASGLVLPVAGDGVADERHLFYSLCSRPQELLALSWRSSSEEGDPLQPSPFLQDVRALFGDSLWHDRRRRLLAEVTWPPHEAPTPQELSRSLAAAREDPAPSGLGPPTSEPVLALLAARGSEAARGLESFSACGVRWLVESLLRPATLEPDPDPLWRGSLAHAVLERTFELLRERTGAARLAPERLAAALDALHIALAEREDRVRDVRRRVLLGSLRADLERYLREESENGPGFEPARLEWSFGRDDGSSAPALELSDGTRVSGRVDRIDMDATSAVIRDYKHRTATPGARWGQDRSLQAGLYALAVRELLGAEPAAVLYQPLAGSDLRPRGIVRAGLEGRYVANDVLEDDEFEAALDGVRALASEAARGIRRGDIRSCPERCSSRGCLHPGICRPGDAAGDASGDDDEVAS